MYLLLCVLLGITLALPLEDVTRNNKNADLSEQYYLPGESRPTFYDVQLFLNPTTPQIFQGIVDIRILPNIITNTIVLHAMEVEIENLTVRRDGDTTDLVANYTLATDDTHLLRIVLTSSVQPVVPHIIHIEYSGRYAENMFGVYRSSYQDIDTYQTEYLITSQLQPTFARRVFPCYDEPHLKAVFRTTIFAPSGFNTVRYNTPLRSDNLKDAVDGWEKFEFEDTLVMSTYLNAYLVSNFESLGNDVNPVFRLPFNIFSRPGTRAQAEYALNFGEGNMVALEDYTRMPYAFPKLDKAAVPDFAAGAMENWGLVIYREVALLVKEGVTTTAIRQNIARIISHENMHMWFGNEVSPFSWTYTWLNEGFANFFENFATDMVLNYRMMDQYLILMQDVMQSDAVLSVNPMTHPVFTPSQIISTFNAVAYQKSGSVIRMLQHVMTPEVFREGLVIYLRDNSRQAVTPTNLYIALQQALDNSTHSLTLTISAFMEQWTTQGGFPVLTVRRTAPTANSLYISQERFLTDPTQNSTDRWHVPVNWVLSTDVNFNDTRPMDFVPVSLPARSYDIPGLSDAEWFIVNKQQTGYYRVNYEPENWAALANVLSTSHNIIHLLNRAQLIDDSFNLARNGRLHYRYAFEISRYLVNETDYIPWASANSAFNYLDVVLSGSDVYDLYQYYLLNLTAPTYARLGFAASETEEHVTPFHRNIILNINCRYGNEDCINQAQTLLQQFRNNTIQSLNPDIQTTVFCSGLRGGDPDNFNFLWQQYLASDDASQLSIYLNALGCTSNATLREFFLQQVLSEDSPVREQDRSAIIISVINASPENLEAGLDFVLENFAEIQPRVQGFTGTTNILNTLARRLSTAEHSQKIAEFLTRYETIFTAGERASVSLIQENLQSSIVWAARHQDDVASWLRENYGSTAASLLSSTLLVVFACVAMLIK